MILRVALYRFRIFPVVGERLFEIPVSTAGREIGEIDRLFLNGLMCVSRLITYIPRNKESDIPRRITGKRHRLSISLYVEALRRIRYAYVWL